MTTLSHLNDQGEANMVDVSGKRDTLRTALAEGYIKVSDAVLSAISTETVMKGDVFAVARVAGIQGAKRCADLIPLCHPLPLTKVDIQFDVQAKSGRIKVTCLCKVTGKTGVEMEALTGVNIALLTLFDMCKAIDPAMCIENVRVVRKEGGKNGLWLAEEQA
ncbi:cyclic pyranopterin monophosphate synthase MoaC [Aestuariibacter sp. A3R04]|uniref:cyclic pyranopterin monophosphate synthase MoaC n=1 Tax=Aestuariibacter sp. A3R04 TaxID=2841571 RepID=UPI001C097523|nr:cyclic pyranopterin monophosphate synthase MoaC [Aestuariibacter sp. A3R04]MBU3023193.1 cyclic pyranopterin monophosphate synthase MoaC [Aestuariibacter sp. A3R04]